MGQSAKKILVALLALTFVFGILAEPAWAIWQNMLDEDFNKDQENPNLRWPWITHRLNNPRRIFRWHYNPRGDWPRAEPNFSPASWGVQDFIFNTHMTPNAEITQSIWCCYCDFNGRNNPRWPDEDQYLNNMNAWTWWGPMNMEEWTGGAVAFWMFNDYPHYARDSLTVLICEPDFVTSNGDVFRENCGIGRTFPRGSQGDWEFHWFYFDSVYVDGELTSMLGLEEVWLAFVWQSDNRDIVGTGAYIDDVTVSWDDGLFDIFPIRTYIGYEVNEDSTFWTNQDPEENDEIKFRLDWGVEGAGETPPFVINCILDDNLVYTDTVTALAGIDSTYIFIPDTIWTVTAADHVLRFELDVPLEDGGLIEESNEDNNDAEREIFVEWNPAPMFEILTPAEDSTRMVGNTYDIHWTVTDSNEFDDTFRIYLYWKEDTTGLAANPDTIFDYNWIYTSLRAARGDGSYTWNYSAEIGEGVIDTGAVFWIVGFASDGYPGNRTTAISPGTLYLPPVAVWDNWGEQLPGEFGLTRAFPNPFNRGLTAEYSLPAPDYIKLKVYDMAGRHITTLVDGDSQAGRHSVAWQPESSPAGVYMLKLEAGSKASLKKIVYMP